MTRTPVRHAPHLAPQEMRVLTYLADGLSTAQTAAVMEIRPATVGSYREIVYTKLGANGPGQAISIAYQLGLLSRTGCTCPTPVPAPRSLPNPSRNRRRSPESLPSGIGVRNLVSLLRVVEAGLVQLNSETFEYHNHRTGQRCTTTLYALEDRGYVTLAPDGDVTITADGSAWLEMQVTARE